MDRAVKGVNLTQKPLFTRMSQHSASLFFGMNRGVRCMSKFRARADRSCPKGRGHYCESGTVSAKNGRHGDQPAKTAERRDKAGILIEGSHWLKARAVKTLHRWRCQKDSAAMQTEGDLRGKRLDP